MTINLDQDTNTLARWASTLNRWMWPDDLPGKLDNFDTLPSDIDWQDARRGTQPTQLSIIMPIMKEIERRIGKKEMLRYHHIHNLKRSNEDFETWWSEKGEPFLDTKVAISVRFDDNGLPIAEARVIKEGDDTEETK